MADSNAYIGYTVPLEQIDESVPAIKLKDLGGMNFALQVFAPQTDTDMQAVISNQVAIIALLTDLNAKIDAGITVNVNGGL